MHRVVVINQILSWCIFGFIVFFLARHLCIFNPLTLVRAVLCCAACFAYTGARQIDIYLGWRVSWQIKYTLPGVAVVTVWIQSCGVLALSRIMMMVTISTRVRIALLPPAAGLVQAQVLDPLPARVKVVETIEAVCRGVAAWHDGCEHQQCEISARIFCSHFQPATSGPCVQRRGAGAPLYRVVSLLWPVNNQLPLLHNLKETGK